MENDNRKEWERKMEESYNFLKNYAENNYEEFPKIDYYQTARENEEIFRNVLRDLKLKDESDLEKTFEKYSEGDRSNKFTIINFLKPSEDSVRIIYELTSPPGGFEKGVGAEIEYKLNPDKSIKSKKQISSWM